MRTWYRSLLIFCVCIALMVSGCMKNNSKQTPGPIHTDTNEPTPTDAVITPSPNVYPLTILIPNLNSLLFEEAQATYDGTAQGILDAIREHYYIGENPEVLSFLITYNGREVDAAEVKNYYPDDLTSALDLTRDFATTLNSLDDEDRVVALGTIVNTFLNVYGINTLYVTVEGVALEVSIDGHVQGEPYTRISLSPTETTVPEYELTLYYPDQNGLHFLTTTVYFDGTPQGIIDALVSLNTIPSGTRVRSFDEAEHKLDLSSEFLEGLANEDSAGEIMLMGSVVNTFLAYYDWSTIMITCEQQIIQAGTQDYSIPQSMYLYDGLDTEAEIFYPDSNYEYFLNTKVNVNGTPESLINALIAYSAIPADVNVLSFDAEDRVLNLSKSFADALLAADEQYEQMLMGSLVNTFVTYYSLENITILSDGEYCVSQRNIYDEPLSFFYL